MLPIRKTHPLTKPVTSSLIDLPAPPNLSSWWNMGSLVSLCLIVQIATGLFLAMHYCPDISLAFPSVAHISRDVDYGWLIRYTHANGASAFFAFIYLHIGRGLYFGSFKNQETWNIGVILLLLSMATAFMGYVLVWGQMSFWGATVITNLLSAIPYVGPTIVEWVWGGFAISNATLNRFFIFHFILPFITAALVMIHLVMLHQSGSNNPLGLNSNFNKIPFHPFYSHKDLLGAVFTIALILMVVLLSPNFFSEPDNFTPANPMVTPTHIKPEWYFLWAYAILRSIPNKLGGVLAMFAAILVLFLIPAMWQHKSHSLSFFPPAQSMFWFMIANIMLLTWIGARPAEPPFIFLGQIFTSAFFGLIVAVPAAARLWNTLINPWFSRPPT